MHIIEMNKIFPIYLMNIKKNYFLSFKKHKNSFKTFRRIFHFYSTVMRTTTAQIILTVPNVFFLVS